ncbi:hypothetical protein D3C78_1474200 [compost metagenome]
MHIHLRIRHLNLIGIQRIFDVFHQIVIHIPVMLIFSPYADHKIQRGRGKFIEPYDVALVVENARIELNDRFNDVFKMFN